jgi:hypothetical protein
MNGTGKIGKVDNGTPARNLAFCKTRCHQQDPKPHLITRRSLVQIQPAQLTISST